MEENECTASSSAAPWCSSTPRTQRSATIFYSVEVISQSSSSSSFRRHRLRSDHVPCIRTLDIEAELVLCSRVALGVRESWRNAQKPLRVSAWPVVAGQRGG